jgi:hypothetical protein
MSGVEEATGWDQGFARATGSIHVRQYAVLIHLAFQPGPSLHAGAYSDSTEGWPRACFTDQPQYPYGYASGQCMQSLWPSYWSGKCIARVDSTVQAERRPTACERMSSEFYGAFVYLIIGNLARPPYENGPTLVTGLQDALHMMGFHYEPLAEVCNL